MPTEPRPAVADDIETCARIIFDAFKGVADHHGFPPAFPSIDVARRVATLLIGLPAIHSLVAVRKEGPAGLLFLDEGDPIRGVSIVAVDPAAQRHGIGRALMQAALERARGARGIRLVQEAFNTGSMGLYASLGFAVKEPLVRLSGRLPGAPVEGVEIRPWTAADLEECERLCRRVQASRAPTIYATLSACSSRSRRCARGGSPRTPTSCPGASWPGAWPKPRPTCARCCSASPRRSRSLWRSICRAGRTPCSAGASTTASASRSRCP